MDEGFGKPRVGIEIEGRRYVAFIDLDKPAEEALDFTTVEDFQSRAHVKVFLFEGSRKTLVKDFEVKNLPRDRAGGPDITLRGKFDGRRTLAIDVALNGRTCTSESLNVGRYLRKKAKAPVAAAAACAAVLVCFLLLFASRHGGVKKAEAPGRTGRWAKTLLTTSGLRGGGAPWRAGGRPGDDAPSQTVGRPGHDEPGNAGERSASRDAPPEGGGAATPRSLPAGVAGAGDASRASMTANLRSGDDREPETRAAAAPTPGRTIGAVYFAPGSARLDHDARAALDRLASRLAGEQGRIVLTGRCALYGTEEGRDRLSVLRAKRVADYLLARGWKPSHAPSVEGVGGRKPVTTDPAAQHLNRMVEITAR
jgi:outer membrane protein OmpA-like peptidoglycan-associated protein